MSGTTFPVKGSPTSLGGRCRASDAERCYAKLSYFLGGKTLDEVGADGGFTRWELDQHAPGWVSVGEWFEVLPLTEEQVRRVNAGEMVLLMPSPGEGFVTELAYSPSGVARYRFVEVTP